MDFVTSPSTAKGKENFINLYARIRHKSKCRKFALGFCITKKEWARIRSLSYQGSALMTSVGMKYGQFITILTKIKAVIEKQPEDSTIIPFLIKSIKAEALTKSSQFVPEDENAERKGVLLDDYMQKYIEQLKSGSRLKSHTSHKVSEGYIRKIEKTLSSVKLYEKVMCSRIELDNVNMEFQRGYVACMNSSGIKANTISSRMSTIRTVAKAAFIEKVTKCDGFMNPEFVPSSEETDAVFLTPERLEQLRTMDLSSVDAIKENFEKVFSGKKLWNITSLTGKVLANFAKTRDIFIVGCLVGQRYSDYHRIGKDMIITLKGKKFIKIRQVKTGKVVIIPLDTRVIEILDKYPDGKLPYINKDTFNYSLKILGELLEWTEYPMFDRKEGEEQKLRFCDMMASHTARRTFATNAYAAGIPLASIMAVTGHSSEKTLRRYLKLQAEDKAIIASDDFEGFIQ